MMDRRVILLIVVVLLAAVGVALYQQANQKEKFFGAVIAPPLPRDGFTLHSEAGPVRLSDFRGKYVVLYFGYTRCPDVCPTTLAKLRQAFADVPEAAERVQVLFISVDYKSDTPQTAHGYARLFHPTFIGLTGSQAEIEAAAKAFGIFYKLNDPDPESGAYTVDHTATTLVVDPQGNLILTWMYGMEPDQIAADLRTLLKK